MISIIWILKLYYLHALGLKNTSNPSISYINGIIEKWKKSDVKTLDDIKRIDDEFKKKSEEKKQYLKILNPLSLQLKLDSII